MLKKFFHCLLVTGLFCPVAAHCATVTVDGNVLVVSGELVVADERSFFEPFEQQAIGVVRFEDCLGGQFGPYDALKGLIETRGLATEAKGVVASGCAFAFMAGYPRRFLDNARGDTQLIFHGAFRRDNGEPLVQGTELLRRVLVERSNHKVDEALVSQIVGADDRRSTFRVLSKAMSVDGRDVFAFRCPFVDGKVACEPVNDMDAKSLGLTTPSE